MTKSLRGYQAYSPYPLTIQAHGSPPTLQDLIRMLRRKAQCIQRCLTLILLAVHRAIARRPNEAGKHVVSPLFPSRKLYPAGMGLTD